MVAGPFAFSSIPPEFEVGPCRLFGREALRFPPFVPLDFDLPDERGRVEPDFERLDPLERFELFARLALLARLEPRERLAAFRVEPFPCVRVFV